MQENSFFGNMQERCLHYDFHQSRYDGSCKQFKKFLAVVLLGYAVLAPSTEITPSGHQMPLFLNLMTLPERHA